MLATRAPGTPGTVEARSARAPLAPSRPAVRRRRVIVVLAAAVIVALVAAVVTEAAAAWVATGLAAAAAAAYVTALSLVIRRAARREWDFEVPDSLAGWADLGALQTDDRVEAGASPTAPPSGGQLAGFLVADAVGALLAPVVFALDLLLRRTPADSTGRRWLAQMQRVQERTKTRSLTALAVGAVTTAGVTGAAFASPAGAATVESAPVPAAAPASAPVSATAPVSTTAPLTSLTVHAGDTVSLIAQEYGTTVASVAAINHLANPNLITIGEVLEVQGKLVAAATAVPVTGTYTVKAGDTLGAIAAHYRTTVAALAGLNRLGNPNLIVVGQVLHMTGTPAAAPVTTTPVPAPVKAAVKTTPVKAVTTAAVKTTAVKTAPAPAPAAVKAVTTAAVTTSKPAPPPAAAPVTGAARAVATALAQIGKPYVWGGAGPRGFDCSGLVMYAWASAGVSLPHYTVAQYEDTTRISASQLQPGDLVFYNNGDGGPQPGHVTMYIGHGEIVTADHSGTPVRVEPIGWDGPIIGYGRVR